MATRSLLSVGQFWTPSALIRWTVLRSPPNVPVAGETSLATIQSQPFRVRLSIALVIRILGLGGEADDERGRLGRAWPGSARMSGLSASSSDGGAAPACFLILRLAACDPPVGDRGGTHRDIDRQRRLAGASICARGLDIDAPSRPPGRQRDRAADQRHLARRAAASAAAIAWPCLPGRNGWRCSAPDRSARASGRW